MKQVFLKSFFQQFDEFLTQLAGLFPDDTDIPTYKTSLAMLQRANPGMAIRQVHEYLLPFADTIRARNEDFFLGKDYSEYSDSISSTIVEKLKLQWQSLSDHNKKVIWDYIILILELSIRYQSAP